VPPALTSKRPRRLRVPPPRERGRRLRRRVENRRSALGGIRIAAGRLDQGLLVALRTRGHGRVAERAAQALAGFGEFGAGWAGLGVLGAAVDREHRRRFLVAAAAAPTAIGANFAVKAAVGRHRPFIEDHPPLGPAPSELSFPSAHATSAIAGATALARVAPRARPPLLALAGLICAGRPYLGMHYPSDVLAGVALGWAIGRAWPLPEPAPAEPPTAPEALR
jgi:membrane-associated phospholipid phosphatase